MHQPCAGRYNKLNRRHVRPTVLSLVTYGSASSTGLLVQPNIPEGAYLLVVLHNCQDAGAARHAAVKSPGVAQRLVAEREDFSARCCVLPKLRTVRLFSTLSAVLVFLTHH